MSSSKSKTAVDTDEESPEGKKAKPRQKEKGGQSFEDRKPRPFQDETHEAMAAFTGNLPEDVPEPETLRAACEACAPTDGIDQAMRYDPASLSKSERRGMLLRKVQTVSIAHALAKRFCKSGIRLELVDEVTAFVDAPNAETEKAVAGALTASDLIEVIRSKPTKKQQENDEAGNLVPQARLGSPGRQCEFYTLHSVNAPYPSKAAAYLFSVAMACARHYPRQLDPPRPGDYAHHLIVASINASNKRLH